MTQANIQVNSLANTGEQSGGDHTGISGQQAFFYAPSKGYSPPDALARQVASPAAPAEMADAHTPNQLTQIKFFIETHLPDADLSPEKIARHFGLSRASLYRAAKPLGGIKHYVRMRRLHHAAAILAQGGEDAHSITRLAYDLGFGSENTFRRAFKDVFGVSPTRVRVR